MMAPWWWSGGGGLLILDRESESESNCGGQSESASRGGERERARARVDSRVCGWGRLTSSEEEAGGGSSRRSRGRIKNGGPRKTHIQKSSQGERQGLLALEGSWRGGGEKSAAVWRGLVWERAPNLSLAEASYEAG